MTTTINGRTPEEIKKGLECCFGLDCGACPYMTMEDECRQIFEDALTYIQKLESVRYARWQFEARGKDGITELPVCSGCGATPKYYVPKNDVGMQVPPYCHECGSKMAAVVKMEVEQ